MTIARAVIKELLRRKDFYIILIFLFAVIVYAGTFSFGGERDFQKYFREIGISFTFIFSIIIAVSFAARQIPGEIESKNIQILLAHPISRLQFIIGKSAGVWIISAASFTLYYLIFIISVFIKGGFAASWILLLEGWYLNLLLLSFLVSLSILLSLFMSTAANITLTLLLYFGNNWFGASAPGYIYIPHLELFDLKERIIHSQPIVPAWVILFLTVYAMCYCAIFIYFSYLVFKKKNL